MIGDGRYKWMAPAWYKALKEFGYVVTFIDQSEFLSFNLFNKLKYKYLYEYSIKELNYYICNKFDQQNYDLVLFYNPYNINEETLKYLKGKSIISGYNHDNYFSSINAKYKILFNNLVGNFDFMHVLRPAEADLLKNKYTETKFFISPHYYCPWDHQINSKISKKRQIVFIGHGENDLRIECVARLIEKNLPIQIYGPASGWQKYLPKSSLQKIPEIRPLIGNDYIHKIQESVICLGFYSKSNYDNYGIRSYEIPACGSFLLSEDTEEMRKLYEPKIEFDVFKNSDELIGKAKFYLENEDKANKIAIMGHKKCLSLKSSVYDRVEQYLKEVI